MSIRHAIWRVGDEPVPLQESSLGKEALLEQMIVKEPGILNDRWMLIGRQVRTAHSGIIDLLALNQDGQLILVELKRDMTPREVVAQALDYASWVQDLAPERIAGIYDQFSKGGSLGDDFKKRYGIDLDEEQLNGSHQIVIVASMLDASTERIVNYLSMMGIAINVIFFQVFEDHGHQYLSRAWLIDPIETETQATSGRATSPKVEWNGEHYVSFGHDGNRGDEARKYGFISSGGGEWYTKTLSSLSEGDRIWVNIPRRGYAGVGIVTGPVQPASEFRVKVDDKQPLFVEVAKGKYAQESLGDESLCEYFVPVKWLATRSLNEAVSEVGFFGNQNTVCRPRTSKWDHTVKRLKTLFSIDTQQPG